MEDGSFDAVPINSVVGSKFIRPMDRMRGFSIWGESRLTSLETLTDEQALAGVLIELGIHA